MLRAIYISILLIVLITDVSSQFYDFFSAFQPIVPTPRNFHYDITTKRPKSTSRQNTKTSENIVRLSFNDDFTKERQKQNPLFDSTTVKSRKTTRKNTQTHDTRLNKTPKDRNVAKPRDRLDNVRAENSRTYNDDRIIFDDGKRNTVISYETTRRYQEYDKKPYQSTQYPFTVRPGVRPVIVNGPPITNKPATQRPNFGPKVEDDISVSPELIIGPDEDYMTSVEKRRYVEMAEKMCDKYKALDNKQIQAIPLLPSPDVVRVNVSTCAPSSVPLVVGGKVVTVDEFPHMALLGWTRLQYGGYSWKCGGSLLSNRYVLTAAHCAYQERDNTVVTGAPRAVQLGSSYLDGQNAVIIKVAAVIRHPKYKLPKSYYDLAIVKMATTVTFSKVIKPACLGTPPPPGQPIIATGWGRTEYGDQSQELRSVSLPVWDMDECYSVLGTSRKIPDGPSSDSQICAGEKRGGKDTCVGDSGGPAQIQDGCTWRVVAVTSLGRSCGAPHTPALYAKVQKAFISAVIFGDQIKKPTQTQNNNQQSNIERNNNQNVYNTDSNNRPLNNNRGNYDDQSDNVNIYNSNRNQNSNGYYNNNDYTTAKPTYNRQPSYNSDYTTAKSNNNRPQNYNNDYTTARPNYNKQPSYNNDYTTAKPTYNRQPSYNNDYTTAKPIYNRPQNYNNDYTTARPNYNRQRNYDYDHIPDYQADNPYYTGSRTWWT